MQNPTAGAGQGRNLEQGGGGGYQNQEQVIKEENKAESSQSRNLYVVCFNCGMMGHLSSTCNKPKVCFICQHPDHVVENCPERLKPPRLGQFFGSARSGLGFFNIDITDRESRFKHWKGMDNFGMLTIVEGQIEEENLIENLKELFDKDWDW